MKKDVVIAFDVGTTNVKCAAVDVANGELAAINSQGYSLLKSQAGYLEIDPAVLWGCVQKSFAAVYRETAENCHYLAISFTWFADCMMLADEDQKPLTNIVQYADTRALGSTMEYFMKKDPLKFCEERGIPPISMFIAPRSEPLKMLWYKLNHPEIFEKARYLFDNEQYILSCLGVEPVNDDSLSAVKRLEDIRKREWSPDLLELYEVPKELCRQRIVSCMDQIGETDHIGDIRLPYPVPVMPGAHDEICAMMGVGAFPDRPGVIVNILGTNDTITYLADYTGKEFPATGILPVRTPYGYFNVGGRGMTMTGAALNWFVDQFVPGEDYGTALSRLFREAVFDASEPMLMVPLYGRSMVGAKDMTLATTPLDIFTALAEGITYEMYYNMESNDKQMYAETGSHISLMLASGGGSRSDEWLKLRASVFGLPIQRSVTTEAGCVGIGLMAAVSLGVYGSFREAADHMVRLGEVIEPDEAQREAYLRKEPKYRALHDFIVPPRRH